MESSNINNLDRKDLRSKDYSSRSSGSENKNIYNNLSNNNQQQQQQRDYQDRRDGYRVNNSFPKPYDKKYIKPRDNNNNIENTTNNNLNINDNNQCKLVSLPIVLKIQKETDPTKLKSRQKDIDFGKNTKGYDNYIKLVPKESREKNHPRTPDKFQRCSRRSWVGQIKKWRKELHKFDLSSDGVPTTDLNVNSYNINNEDEDDTSDNDEDEKEIKDIKSGSNNNSNGSTKESNNSVQQKDNQNNDDNNNNNIQDEVEEDITDSIAENQDLLASLLSNQ
eukprot:gene11388-13947_t